MTEFPSPEVPAATGTRDDDAIVRVLPREQCTIEHCPVCGRPGVLERFDPDKGFLISHDDRIIPCRAPANPPEAPDGELTVPAEINLN